MDSSLFFVMLKRELLWRFSFFISGATQLTGFEIGVTGGVLFPGAFVLPLLLTGVGDCCLLLLFVFVCDVKACNAINTR